MAIIGFESFELYSTGKNLGTEANGRWIVGGGGSNLPEILVANGNGPDGLSAAARSLNCQTFVGVSPVPSIKTPSFTPVSTFVVAFFIYLDGIPDGENVLALFDSNGVHIGCLGIPIATLRPGWYLADSPGIAGGVYASRADTALTVNAWNHVQMKIVPHASAGSVSWRIEDSDAGTDSGIQTKEAAAASSVGALRVGGVNSVFSGSDDHFASNVEITPLVWATDWVGRCVAHGGRPTADGAVLDFTPQGAGDHYVEVNDQPPVDAEYNASDTPGDRDLYDYPNVPANVGTILAVQGHYRAYAEIGGPDLKAVQDDGSNETLGPTESIATSVAGFSHLSELAPDGGAWTIAKANATELGVEVV